MISRTQRGREIESRAQIDLQVRGFKIIGQNYRKKFGELDFILEENSRVLVFLEVRSKKSGDWRSGLEMVSPEKIRRLKLTAQSFLSHYRGLARDVRFDLMVWNGLEWEYYINAWQN